MTLGAIFSKNNFYLWLLICCVASFTVFQFIPIYFTRQMPRLVYYTLVYVGLVISSVSELQRYFRSTRQYLFTKIAAVIILFFLLLIALLWVLFSATAVWTEAATYYIKRDNCDVKIITRYIDNGAFGGGTEPGDYHMVLHRPVTPYFKLETAVDTNKIDKKDWVKARN